MRTITTLVAAAVATAVLAGTAQALPAGVSSANPDAGHPANRLLAGYRLVQLAAGTDRLENPSGVIRRFGYLRDAATVPAGTKTEPDQNLYLVFPHGLGGPTAGFHYGSHFVFQGHENEDDLAYITRVNLDVSDPAHRITLLTPVGHDGLTHFNAIDGSSWDPFTHTALFTQEAGSDGGVIEVAPDGSRVRTLYGQIGHGSYEGIHPDGRGNLLIQEDEGGTSVHTDPGDPASPVVARQPNSFQFRFLPSDPHQLGRGGRLQALQVWVHGHPVVFHADDPVADVFSVASRRINTPGSSWRVRWVTVHDTAADGSAPFDANALAKAAGATPFRRPENGGYQPGSHFRSFVFAATGDTDAQAGQVPALAARGSWGALYRVHLDESGNRGRLSIVALGDADHASFDNVAFAGPRVLLTAEDRGNTLHQQLNMLDSVWGYRLGDPAAERFLALGRDRVSEADAAAGGDDNEPTGLTISNGRITRAGMLGTTASLDGARMFITQQHGRNRLWEIVRQP